jgi:hypothetical protein
MNARREILAALYLHLRPFSRFIVASVDRQIASIDSGGRVLAEAPTCRSTIVSALHCASPSRWLGPSALEQLHENDNSKRDGRNHEQSGPAHAPAE